jgi:uncharacterized protein YacL
MSGYQIPFINKEIKPFNFVEILILIGVVVSIAVLVMDNSPKQEQYIPNVISGLFTLSSLLVASISFWLNRSTQGNLENLKGTMRPRSILIGVTTTIGVLILIGGLIQMVYSTLETSFEAVLGGTLIIIFTFLEVLALAIGVELQLFDQPEEGEF